MYARTSSQPETPRKTPTASQNGARPASAPHISSATTSRPAFSSVPSGESDHISKSLIVWLKCSSPSPFLPDSGSADSRPRARGHNRIQLLLGPRTTTRREARIRPHRKRPSRKNPLHGGAVLGRALRWTCAALSSVKELLPRIFVRGLLERLERLTLGLRQLLRNGDAHAREQVAAAGALELRRAAPTHPQELPVLGARRHLQRDRAVRGRHFDRCPESGFREGHRDVDHEIRPPPLVELRRRDSRDHVQIAGGRASVPGLALAAQLDPRAVPDPGGELDLVPLRPPLTTGAVAARTRILDHSSVPPAARAGLREREQALALGLDAAAAALGTDDRRRSGLRSRAAARAAACLELDRNLHLSALERVLERDVHLDFEVGSALAALLGAPPASCAAASEEAAEDVAEITEVAQVEVAGEVVVAALEARPAAPVRRPERVVLLALLRVGENVVGGLDLLEALLRRRVPGVLVRVVLASELPIRLLDLVLRGGLGNTEACVEVVDGSQVTPAPPPRPAGPRSRPAPDGGHGRRAGSPSAAPPAPSLPRGRTAASGAPRGRAGRTFRPPRPRPGLRGTERRAASGRRAALRLQASPPRVRPRPAAPVRGRPARAEAPSRAARGHAWPDFP